MRMWITNGRIAALVLLCTFSAGIVACTKNAPANVQGPKVDRRAEAEASRLKANIDVKADDPAGTDRPREKVSVHAPIEHDPREAYDWNELFAREFAPTQFDVGEPSPVVLQDVKKKPKDKKDPDKSSTKDTSKEPKTLEYKEPTEVLGKTFSDWMKDMKSNDPSKREIAMKTIVQFGPKKAYEAAPEIMRQLERHTLKNQGIDLSMRVNGLIALTMILKYKNYKEWDPKEIDAAYAIYKYFLRDPQVVMKVRAVQGIIYLGPKAREAIDEVIKVAKDTSTWEVRKEGLQTLTLLAAPEEKWGKPHSPKAIAVARGAMSPGTDVGKEPSYLVRMLGVQALGALNEGKVPPEYFFVGKGLDDPTVQVRLEVLKSIAILAPHIDKTPEQQIVIGKLSAYLNAEKDPILRIWAHATFMTVTKKITKLHMDPVVKKVGDDNPAVRLQALTVIGLGGKDSKPIALSVVKAAVDDKDINVGVAAIVALLQMDADECVPMLEKIEEDKRANEVLKATASNALDEFHKRKLDRDKKDKTEKK